MNATLFFKKLLQNIRSEKKGFFLNLCCLAVAFLSVTAVATILVNLSAAIDSAQDSFQVTIYLKESAPAADIQALEKAVRRLPEVADVKYVSSEAFRDNFLASHTERKGELGALDARIFPATLQVKMAPEFMRKEDAAAVIGKIQKVGVVEEIGFHEDWMKKLDGLLRFVWAGFLFFGVLILASSLFVLANTIQLSFARRRKAIEVMRMCGATTSYIEAPYLLEGLLMGLTGGLLSVAVTGGLMFVVKSQVSSFLEGFAGVNISFMPAAVLVALLTVCALTGMSGAYIASRRVLRV